MSEALDRLRAANRYEMKLDNGIPLTYRLPFMEELMIAGLLPLDLVDQVRARLAQGGTQVEAESVAEEAMEERLSNLEKDFEAKQRVVAVMVDTLDGEAVTLGPDDTREIPPNNFHALVRAAISRTPVEQDG